MRYGFWLAGLMLLTTLSFAVGGSLCIQTEEDIDQALYCALCDGGPDDGEQCFDPINSAWINGGLVDCPEGECDLGAWKYCIDQGSLGGSSGGPIEDACVPEYGVRCINQGFGARLDSYCRVLKCSTPNGPVEPCLWDINFKDGQDTCAKEFPQCPGEWECPSECPGSTICTTVCDFDLQKCTENQHAPGAQPCGLECMGQEVCREECRCGFSGTCYDLKDQHLVCARP